ncbi:hypothetical protein BP6252_10145 [Coleophoma cylindrospora]|uniref:Uncharacterized protein n=1 Tax=Coleophoma cylindrospora TaxID=1849047 RepID=A0A3D8QXU3_9HELO|nr:hypothetical protein BP6252_10145 [Coleophoma cylindrospora]
MYIFSISALLQGCSRIAGHSIAGTSLRLQVKDRRTVDRATRHGLLIPKGESKNGDGHRQKKAAMCRGASTPTKTTQTIECFTDEQNERRSATHRQTGARRGPMLIRQQLYDQAALNPSSRHALPQKPALVRLKFNL